MLDNRVNEIIDFIEKSVPEEGIDNTFIILLENYIEVDYKTLIRFSISTIQYMSNEDAISLHKRIMELYISPIL